MRRLILILMTCLLLCAGASASEISKLHTTAEVQPDGSSHMTVEAALQLDEAVDTIVVPLGYRAYDATVDNAEAKIAQDKDGFSYLTLDGAAAGTRTICVRYKLPASIAEADDGITWTLSLLPGHWSWPIRDYTFSVSLPEPVAELSPSFVSGYFGDVIVDYMHLQQTEQTFSGSVEADLHDRETIDVTLTLPEKYFGNAVKKANNTDLPALYAVALLFWVGGFCYWAATIRMPQNRARVRRMPPDGTSAGEIGMLFFGQMPSAVGMLMQWAALGYVAIGVRRSKVVIYRKMSMGNERKGYETALFRSLFRNGDQCSSAQFHAKRLEMEEKMQAYWRKRIFDPKGGSILLFRILTSIAAALVTGLAWKNGAQVFWLLFPGIAAGFVAGMALQRGCSHAARREMGEAFWWIFVPIAVMLPPVFFGGGLVPLAAIALQLAAGALTAYGPRRTRVGRELLAQCHALKRFLMTAKKKQLRKCLEADPQYFYTLLPYAEEMGCGKEFAERFGGIVLEPCEWIWGSRATTAGDFYEGYRKISDLLREKL